MHDLIIQRPAVAEGQVAELFLLFHGVGSNAQDLRSLGDGIAARHPFAWVVSVQSPNPSDLGQGWQWFSVRGVTAENRSERVAQAMPGFVQTVQRWQHESGVRPRHSTLVGFSQGAIMALESTQGECALAARVVALAGRFASPPRRVPDQTRVHLLHGSADGVVPTQASVEAKAQLDALNAEVTLDLFPGLGHGIDGRMLERLNQLLSVPA